MKNYKTIGLLIGILSLLLVLPAFAQQTPTQQTQTPSRDRTTVPSPIEQNRDQDRATVQGSADQNAGQSSTTNQSVSQNHDQTRPISVAAGQKQKIRGVIVKREADSFVLRDLNGTEFNVALTNDTEVKERKSNPFRGAKKYPMTSLLQGLNVEVEGRGDNSGALVAKSVKMTETELAMARTTEARVTPVEGRVGEAENRLTSAEANAQRLSGQISELEAVANAAKGGAKAAQETADAALAGVSAANERISTLDDYDARTNTSVLFKVRSAVLSPEAKTILDQIATQAKTEKGFIIQITGFASADGNENYNRQLSQRRADSVVRYLVETHNIPLRRIITPFGFGELQPVADNSTREGREQNRRVEVAILVNKGLTSSSSAANTPPERQEQQ